jgi:capsular exopolysaccharide synthesis family protein
MAAKKNLPSESPEEQHLPILNPEASNLGSYVLPPKDGTEDEDMIDLREYWYIILKRRWTIVTFFGIIFVFVLMFTLLQTPLYRSAALVQIESGSNRVMDYKSVTPEEYFPQKDFYQTQYELLKSKTLAQRVIDQLNLDQNEESQNKNHTSWWGNFFKGSQSDLEKEKRLQVNLEAKKNAKIASFLGNLKIEPVRNSRLVKIAFLSPDPNLAARVVNLVAESFITISMEKKYQANAYAKTFLEERIAQVKIKLEEAERAQVEYAKQEKIFNFDKGAESTNSQSLQDFNSALSRAQQERIKAESVYRELELAKEGDLPQQLESALIQQLKANKAKLESDYQEKLKTFKPLYPAMIQLKAQIDGLTSQIQKETLNVKRSIRVAYETAKSNEAMLNTKLNSQKDELLNLQSRSIQFNILKREADTNRQLYDGLLQRLKEVSVSGDVNANNILIVDRAEIPQHPYSPNLMMNMIIAILLGLFGGIGLAVLFEYLDNTFKNVGDIEKFLGIPVLGLIPDAPEELSSPSAIIHETLNNSKSKIVEAFRSTRTALQFSTATGAPKVLGLTSCFASEGKSTSSVSLAIHFAQCGSSVLLIDADLRRASLHKAFEIENKIGLSNILAGLSSAGDAIYKTPVENLHFMASGTLPPNPAELMLNGRFEELLEKAKEKFDLIIVDGPPILGLADAIIIANLVEKLLVVIEAGSTPRNMATAAMKRLKSSGIKPLGVIFNKMKNDPLGYGYDYYYYYAHGYYGEDMPGLKGKKKPQKEKS